MVSCVAGSSNKSTDVKLCVIGGGGGVGILDDFLSLSMRWLWLGKFGQNCVKYRLTSRNFNFRNR